MRVRPAYLWRFLPVLAVLGPALACRRAPALVPTPATLEWADSAAVLRVVLDSLHARRRARPLVIGLLSCAHLRAPCARHGGWAEDSTRAQALLATYRVIAPRPHLEDSVEVIRLGAPLFAGRDTAAVMVYTVEGPPPRPGRGFAADWRMLIVRQGGRWQLARGSLTRIT